MKRLLVLTAATLLMGSGCLPKSAAWQTPVEEPPTPVAATTTAEVATSTEPSAPPAAAKPNGTKPTTTAKPNVQPVVKPANGYVTIQNMTFGPQILAINVGATVTWTNKDSVNHTVDSDAIRIFNSGNIPVGGSFSHTFKASGTYTYYCGVHPSMKGTIVVH